MQSIWKKMSLAVLVSFALPCLLAAQTKKEDPFAKRQKSHNVKEEPMPTFEPGTAITKDQMSGGYNAPAALDTKGCDVFLRGSFLYWQAIEEDIQLTESSLGGTSTNFAQKTYGMNFDFHPGFKVALGTNLNHDGWDLSGEYTWFHAANKAHFDPTGDVLTSTKIDGIFDFSSNNISATWRLKMDIADLALGRSYYVGTNLILRPYFCIRGAWLNQTYKEKDFVINTNAGDLTPTPVNAELQYIAKTHNWGVGPRIGVDFSWMLAKEFSLFTKVATSLLYSHYRIVKNENHVFNTTTTPGVFNNYTALKKFYAIRPELDIVAGLGWGTYFCDQNYHFDLSAAYEFHTFFFQEDFITPFSGGSIYINGLNITARLDF